ncbi:hypothetical protein [Microbacterium proteolyticum]|uniref:hypothetical protein n=1 Tax=Microbacterium proteolyticum TaxID=1572644 RepID=UPI001FACEE65|nr:hypothetical protein [Microbacterium proteolyticum]MCI9859547.1 hypothetical protein [Microbacterium proteolyticum]
MSPALSAALARAEPFLGTEPSLATPTPARASTTRRIARVANGVSRTLDRLRRAEGDAR